MNILSFTLTGSPYAHLDHRSLLVSGGAYVKTSAVIGTQFIGDLVLNPTIFFPHTCVQIRLWVPASGAAKEFLEEVLARVVLMAGVVRAHMVDDENQDPRYDLKNQRQYHHYQPRAVENRTVVSLSKNEQTMKNRSDLKEKYARQQVIRMKF